MPVNRNSADILLFEIADRRGGLPVEDVVEVLRAVAVTPLPRAPHLIEGIVNVRGEVVPVIDLRARFGLPRRKMALTDRLIIVRAGSRTIAMRADAAGMIATIEAKDIDKAEAAGPDREQLRGVAKLADGLALIHDVESFLSATEEEELDRALAEGGGT